MSAGARYGHHLYFAGLCLLAIALPFSKFLISISLFMLGAGWLGLGNYRNRIRLYLQNKTALLLGAVFLLHLIGLAYSTDLTYGWEDIRKKLPLLLMPFLFVSGPKITQQWLRRILSLFVVAVVVSCLIVLYRLHMPTINGLAEVREASLFVSHIRLSLMIALATAISVWLFLGSRHSLRFLLLLLPLLFILTVLQLQAMTGLIIIFISAVLMTFWYVFSTQNRKGWYVSGLILVVLLFAAGWIAALLQKEYQMLHQEQPFTLKEASPEGEPYFHSTERMQLENGNRIFVNIAWNELRTSWNERSELPYDGPDRKGNQLEVTLLRYLASYGYDKDASAIAQLEDHEIDAIENGIPNHRYLDSPLIVRLRKIAWELDNYARTKNPSGHSLTMRFEFWKAAIHIIRNNPWIGVGTGDVKEAYAMAYLELESPLEERWQLRAHNQYLAIGVALGIFGMLLFVLSLLYPLWFASKGSVFLYYAFFIIAALSMITEDTLETQAGITFYTFFNCLLLFSAAAEEIRKSD